jgi:hypothetical protein
MGCANKAADCSCRWAHRYNSRNWTRRSLSRGKYIRLCPPMGTTVGKYSPYSSNISVTTRMKWIGKRGAFWQVLSFTNELSSTAAAVDDTFSLGLRGTTEGTMRTVVLMTALLLPAPASAQLFGVRDFPTMPCEQFLHMSQPIQDAWSNGFYVGVAGRGDDRLHRRLRT